MDLTTIVLIVIGVFILFLILIYNRIINLNNRTKNAWSGIDNQLKRRNDLIPNLIETVKGYAAFEKETLKAVIDARKQMTSSTSIKEEAKASDDLSQALGSLFMLSESYPDLKANKSFERLQIELVGTEDKIAYARQFYNDSVQQFNDMILVFPNNIFAKYLKFTSKEYFKVSDKEKENVKVEFNNDTK